LHFLEKKNIYCVIYNPGDSRVSGASSDIVYPGPVKENTGILPIKITVKNTNGSYFLNFVSVKKKLAFLQVCCSF
jgi:hypothetical protein